MDFSEILKTRFRPFGKLSTDERSTCRSFISITSSMDDGCGWKACICQPMGESPKSSRLSCAVLVSNSIWYGDLSVDCNRTDSVTCTLHMFASQASAQNSKAFSVTFRFESSIVVTPSQSSTDSSRRQMIPNVLRSPWNSISRLVEILLRKRRGSFAGTEIS